ncbi:hypothetical protein HDU98_010141 [Podochytrium sp. JEL0797]|nr:hypothetical protein HDU98_010141 [Podochytrium sp. JEL0797]
MDPNTPPTYATPVGPPPPAATGYPVYNDGGKQQGQPVYSQQPQPISQPQVVYVQSPQGANNKRDDLTAFFGGLLASLCHFLPAHGQQNGQQPIQQQPNVVYMTQPAYLPSQGQPMEYNYGQPAYAQQPIGHPGMDQQPQVVYVQQQKQIPDPASSFCFTCLACSAFQQCLWCCV